MIPAGPNRKPLEGRINIILYYLFSIFIDDENLITDNELEEKHFNSHFANRSFLDEARASEGTHPCAAPQHSSMGYTAVH